MDCLAMRNGIKEFAKSKGIESQSQFAERTGIKLPTVYRLWRDPSVYPSRSNQEAICRAFNAQPGEFLRFVLDS